jgi:hypothetical protein
MRSALVLTLIQVISAGGEIFSLAADTGTKWVRMNPNKMVVEILDLKTLPNIRKG